MDPANSLLPAWYPYDYNMPTPYPSPAPSDPYAYQLNPSSGPDRQPRRAQRASPSPAAYSPPDAYSMPSPYSPYDHRPRPRSAAPFDHARGPSPALSSVSSLSDHRGPPPSASPVPDTPVPRLAPRRQQARHTKHRLRDADRKAICLYSMAHPHARQEDIGAVFQVERSTISKILKEKNRWLNISPEAESSEQTAKHRPSKFPLIEEEMERSIKAWAQQRVNITDNLLRTRALEIAATMHINTDRFKGSSGWVENFKARHGIRRGEYTLATPFTTQHRGAIPPSQTMGMGFDDRADAHDDTKWGASPHVRPADAPPSLVLDDSHTASAASSSAGSAEIHTPLQTQLPLDPAAIQHSPDGYDSARGDAYLHSHYAQQQQQQQHAAPSQYTHAHEHEHAHAHSHTHTHAQVPEASGPEAPLAVVGDLPPPTVAEADEAMTVVLAFIDRCAPDGFLLPAERDALGHVKCALFNLVSGLPYSR